uniref:Uncharacterized protein n=1 Tax=Tanacetum cinerariifolium TaxID=118510 RepID=A0A6L2KWD7_TANCI|nr:hypothetical protein [Tanacetum cinerariifolium]
MVKETSDEPSLAKRSKPGLVIKKRKPTSSLRLVDEFVDEGVSKNEPRFDDEEANLQREMEESLKDVHATHRGPLPPVVFREPDSGRCQPLPESTTGQYILQRCTPKNADPTGPSTHHEVEKDTRADVETDTEELLTHTEKSGKEMSNTVVLATESGGQDEKQGGPDPGDSADSRPLPSQEILIGLSLDPMDEGFTEPASFIGTLSSLQHLTKDFSFGDQFFNDKPSEAENEKTTVKTKAELMVSTIIQQDTFAILSMTTPMIDLTSRPDSPNAHQPLPATATETKMTTTTTHPPPPQPQQSTTDSILIKRIDELEQIMTNLIQDKKHLEERLDSHGELPKADMKEILHQRMWETNSYQANKDNKNLYKSLEKLMVRDQTDQFLTDLAEARRKKKKRHDSPKNYMGLHLIIHLLLHRQQEGQSHGSTTPSSSKIAASAEYIAWTTSDTRFKPSLLSILEDLHMDDDSAPDEQKPLSEEDRPATPEPAWSIPSSDLPVPINNWASALASTYALPLKNSLLAQTGDMATFIDCKGSRLALSISKLKATYYLDVGLEQIVPDQMLIEEECKYDIAAIDGTLRLIDEALDYRVKEFKVNKMNPGLNTRFWTRKDVDRSKEFMFAIQKRLKTRRIFRNLESFVGGRVKEGDYRLLQRIE